MDEPLQQKEIVQNLHKLGIPFVELTNGEVVTLYSALERGFQKNAMEEAEELIRMDEVLKLTKACRASINNYVTQGSFRPKSNWDPARWPGEKPKYCNGSRASGNGDARNPPCYSISSGNRSVTSS